MIFIRLLKPGFVSTLFTLFITLQITSCSTEDLESAAAAAISDSTKTTADTSDSTDFTGVPDTPDAPAGSNNAAVISGIDRATVIEDIDPDADNLLEAAGKLDITDNDVGEAAFAADTSYGAYGSLNINTSGSWNYAANNDQGVIQNLSNGESLKDTLTVRSVDATAHAVVITIYGVDEPAGANNPAVISGTDRASVVEDVDPDADNLLEVTGKLNITDSDAGEAAFVAVTSNGTYGSLNINVSGSWNYSANNDQSAIQNLVNGATLRDALTVRSVDGTTHVVIITIIGVDEPAQVTGHNAARANSYDDAWDSAWVSNAQTILAAPTGITKTVGKVLQVGDSMTYSFAYGDWARNKTGATASDVEIANWMHAGVFDSTDGWALSSNGTTAIHNAGWGSFIDNIIVNSTLNDAQFAVVMFNATTNLVFVEGEVNKLISVGIVPVLSTIPPRTDLDYNRDVADPYNVELLALAERLGLPIINYSKEILLRRPNGTWAKTLIGNEAGTDGVHPTGGVNGYNAASDPYADGGDAATLTTGDATLNSGYLLRTWLTMQKLKEIKQKVVDSAGSGGTGGGGTGGTGGGSGSTTPTNNPANISGTDTGGVTEDVDPDGDNLLEDTGKLNISDSDAGEASFTAATSYGTYGSISIDAAGNWSYAANNGQGAIQNLTSSNTLTDYLDVSSVDGTTHTVVITIIGADEPGQGGGTGGGAGGGGTVPVPTEYDVIYVRYPIATTEGTRISMPAGENPYPLKSGADLMLLKPNGTEKVLVDCTDCSVMDPYIALDGKTVYYSYNEKAMNSPYGDEYASWIYKIHLEGHPAFNNHAPIRMTFNDGYDSVLYKANQNTSGNLKSAGHDQSYYRAIRDMAPVPLADGRLLFTSNRSALTAFHPGTDAVIKGSVQQLYVMDDHDGSATSGELANIQRLETGNIHMVQHPIQLKDGRILFSTWQDVGTKIDIGDFQYASTPLFTIHPDGSNLQQFTEPHDHHKNVEHFISQLSDEQVVWGQYYPLQEGFGQLMRAPVSSAGPDFLRESVDQRHTYGNQYPISFREFDRVGTVTITPHTNGGDTIAPSSSGKYSMPAATADGGLFVAYSTGSVNQTGFVCEPSGQCESLKSGIYMIPEATGGESTFITDPASQLVKIKDDLNYNEIWPRPVLSYQQIYGVEKPALLNDLSRSVPDDDRLAAGEAKSILGTSSMYNREPLNEADPDPFYASTSRENTDGNWTIQGAEAGVFTDDDIYGVRIIATPPKPYTKPIDAYSDGSRWNNISRHLYDNRLSYVVARYGSTHGERWEILGEFPVKKAAVTDGQGNPDTSWMAKIPSDTPTFVQTIDKNGMTLMSELAWRGLKSGEKRADCGGCHAHSVEPLDIATTEAGKRKPITGIAGVSSTAPEVKDGMWDLTSNKIPLLNDVGVTFEPGYTYGVEFNRDIVPILNSRCVSCHQAGQSGQALILNNDPWSKIMQTGGYDDNAIQVSRYIRMPQARQSLFVWATWGERLDGRSNADRGNDIDFNGHPGIPGLTDEEKRSIARWVDLGSPIDFPNTEGMGYTDDYQLPVVNIYTPQAGGSAGAQLKVGFNDAMSGLDWSTLSVKYYEVGAGVEQAVAINVGSDVNAKDILTKNLGLSTGEYVVIVSVKDMAGNVGRASRRFKVN